MRAPRLLSCLLLSMSLATPLLAAAEGQTGVPAPGAQSCRAEIRKLCGSSSAGDGHVRQCLEQNRNALSPACQQRMAEHQQRAHQKAEACRADAEQFCKGMEPGGGRIMRCLKENEARLSPICRDSMARPRDRRAPQS